MAAVREFVRRNRVDCLIVLCVLAVLAPIVADDAAQPASRFALTAAIAEHRSVDITPYRPVLGIDYSVYHGLRSDKAPGQPFFAAPAYVAARVVGAESAAHKRIHRNLTLWFVTFWSCALPFAALLVLMRRTIEPVAPLAALPLTLATAGGALLLPYSVNLYGHVLAALLGLGAFVLLTTGTTSVPRVAIAGALAGAAVFVEYETLVIAVVLLAFLFVRHRSSVGSFVLGALPWAIALAAYEWVAFGAPWHFPYATYAQKLNGTADLSVRNPLTGATDVLGGAHGLWITAPLVLVALVGCVMVVRRGNAHERDCAAIALAIFFGYLAVESLYAGAQLFEIPGPRFLIPAFPIIVVAMAPVAGRLRLPIAAPAIWGSFLMAAATWTTLVTGHNAPVFSQEKAYLQAHNFAPTLWNMAFGRFGDLLYAVTAFTAIALLIGAIRSEIGSEHTVAISANWDTIPE